MTQKHLFEERSMPKEVRTNCWIHRIPLESLELVFMRKIIGSSSSRNRKVKEVQKGDKVLLATTLIMPQKEKLPAPKKIAFVAWAQIGESYQGSRPEVGYDQHRTKHRLGELYFFAEPCSLEKAIELGAIFLLEARKPSDALKNEYRTITEEDFLRIVSAQKLLEKPPDYVFPKKLSGSLKLTEQQLLTLFKQHRELLRAALPARTDIEVRVFLETLADVLQKTGAGGDYEALYGAYRRLAHQLGFRHSPSREPHLQVELLDKNGRSALFAYLSLR